MSRARKKAHSDCYVDDRISNSGTNVLDPELGLPYTHKEGIVARAFLVDAAESVDLQLKTACRHVKAIRVKAGPRRILRAIEHTRKTFEE